jgi:hypothetical protein
MAALADGDAFLPASRAAAGAPVPIRLSARKAWVSRIATAGAALFFGGLFVAGLAEGSTQQAVIALLLAAAMVLVLYTAERGHAAQKSRGYLLRVDSEGIAFGAAPPVRWDAVHALELRRVRRSVAERNRVHLVLHTDAATVAAVEPALKASLFGGDIGHVQRATCQVLLDVSAMEYEPHRVIAIVRAAWERHADAAATANPEPARA